jgi:hypothetical protein
VTDEQKDTIAAWAVISLTVISLAGILGGIAVAYFGAPVGAIVAVVTGAVGGIVAIVLRKNGT